MVMILRLAFFANPIITQVGSLDGGPYHYPHYAHLPLGGGTDYVSYLLGTPLHS
jgi:hypothetical protein